MKSVPYSKQEHIAFQVFILTTSEHPLQILLGIHHPHSDSRRWDSETSDALQANHKKLTLFSVPSNL